MKKESKSQKAQVKGMLSVVPTPSQLSSETVQREGRSKPHRVTLDLSSEQYKKLKFAAIAGRARGVKEGSQVLDSMSAILEAAMDIVINKHPSLSEPLGPDDFC